MSKWGYLFAALGLLVLGGAIGVWGGFLVSERSAGGAMRDLLGVPVRRHVDREARGPQRPSEAVPAPSSALGSVNPPGAPFESLADLVEDCRPAVFAVGLQVSRDEVAAMLRRLGMPQGSARPEEEADPAAPEHAFLPLGSGFAIDATGVFVTNNHVVAQMGEWPQAQPAVRDMNGETHPVSIVGVDQETDLAALRAETAGDFAVLSWGDSDKARIGDYVVAIGSPFGLESTVTQGIISAKGRQDVTPSNPFARTYDDFLQTDAAINPGNSGGPLIALDGQVIGINTSIQTDTPDPTQAGSIGIGFAVPSTVASFVVDQLVRNGRVVRGYIGVELPKADRERELGTYGRGAIVSTVVDDKPADRAGLRPNDLVTELDGRTITCAKDLIDAVAVEEPGKSLPLVYERDGEAFETRITVAERPSIDDLAGSTRSEEEVEESLLEQLREDLGALESE